MVNIVALCNLHNHSLVFVDKALTFFERCEFISTAKVDGSLLFGVHQHHAFSMWEKTFGPILSFIFIHWWQLGFANSDEIRLVISQILLVHVCDRRRIICSYMRVTELLTGR